MDILKEHKLLLEIVETFDGWQKIEGEWMEAMGMVRTEGGGFTQESSSCGNKVAGFAIDEETMEYDVGVFGGDHGRSVRELYSVLRAKDPSFDADRIVDGRIISIPSFTHPIVFLRGNIGDDVLIEKLERHILEKGVGLPIRSILERYLRKQ